MLIHELTDKLDSQVRKHKEKITDHHRNGGALKDQILDLWRHMFDGFFIT